jgi:hypothetical protein
MGELHKQATKVMFSMTAREVFWECWWCIDGYGAAEEPVGEHGETF